MTAMRLLATMVVALLVAAGCADGTTGPPTTTTGPATSGATTTPTGSLPAVDRPVMPWPGPLVDDHQRWTIRVIDRHPHDPAAFTQGLEFTDEGLLESTGLYGESTLRITDPATGEILRSTALDPALFGEGVTSVEGEIVQLTWQAGRALRYGDDLVLRDEDAYDGEGWGICYDGGALWTTDGTATLTERRVDGLVPVRSVEVTRDGEPVERLNELECIDGHVVANVWGRDEIVVIDPTSGIVRATIDAAILRAEVAPTDGRAVLNGIADPGDGTLVLAGKLWPTLFVVELVDDGG